MDALRTMFWIIKMEFVHIVLILTSLIKDLEFVSSAPQDLSIMFNILLVLVHPANLSYSPTALVLLATHYGTQLQELARSVSTIAHGTQLPRNVNVMPLTLLLQMEVASTVLHLVQAGMPRQRLASSAIVLMSSMQLAPSVNVQLLTLISATQVNASHATKLPSTKHLKLALYALKHGSSTKQVQNASAQLLIPTSATQVNA